MKIKGRFCLVIALLSITACTSPTQVVQERKATEQLAFLMRRTDGCSMYTLSVGNDKPYLAASDIACRHEAPTFVWSPDSQALAYLTGTAADQGVNIISDINKATEHRYVLSKQLVVTSGPSWSIEGSSLLFSARQNSKENVYVWRYKDNSLLNLTSKIPGASFNPVRSPDSTKIAFLVYPAAAQRTSQDCAGGCLGNLYLMASDGSGIYKATDFDVASKDRTRSFAECNPLWSNSGQYLAFEVGCDVNADPQNIYVLDTVGKHLLKTTHMENQPLQLVSLRGWLRNGFLIYAIPNLGQPPAETLFESMPDGTSAAKFMDLPQENTNLDLTDISWSSDGTRVVGVNYLKPDKPEIIVVDRDNKSVKFTGQSGWSPQWSPMGDSVTFIASDGIWSLNVDTGSVMRLTDYAVDNFVWGPPP